MLTQKQIEYQRKMIELQIKRWKVPHGFINMNPTFAAELLDMAETLLAVIWATENFWDETGERWHCSKCPFDKNCGEDDYLCNCDSPARSNHRGDWLQAYREAQKIEGVE